MDAALPASKPDPLAVLLDKVRPLPEARSFFKSLWEDQDYARLFFAHREILFNHMGDQNLQVALPFFFVDTLPQEPVQKEAVGQVLVTASELREQKSHAVVASMEQTTQEVAEDLKAIGCMIALRLIKQNPHLAALLASDVSFTGVKQALDGSQLALDLFSEFQNIEKIWEGKQVADPGDKALHARLSHYADGIKKFTKRGVGIGQVFKMMDFSMGMAPMYVSGHKHVESLLQNQGLDAGRYVSILHSLYISKLISSLGTVFWCGQCDDDPFLVATSSRLSPRHLRLNCPKCERPTYFGAIYEIVPPILDAILWKDGLLGAAVGWLLRERNIKFKSGEYTGDRETDFRFSVGKLHCLFETKMYKTGKDSDSVHGNLTKSVVQALDHAKAIKAKGEPLNLAFTVVNYDLSTHQQELESVKAKFQQDMETHHVWIVEALHLPKMLEQVVKESK